MTALRPNLRDAALCINVNELENTDTENSPGSAFQHDVYPLARGDLVCFGYLTHDVGKSKMIVVEAMQNRLLQYQNAIISLRQRVTTTG